MTAAKNEVFMGYNMKIVIWLGRTQNSCKDAMNIGGGQNMVALF